MPTELLALALLSAFWPTLVLIDVLAFQTAKPERILLAFLAGGLLTTVTIGTLLVVALERTHLGSSSQRSSPDGLLYLMVGGLAFILAFVLRRRRDRPRKPSPGKSQGRSDVTAKMIKRGAPLAFVAGILCNIFPGVFPLIALRDIAEQRYSTVGVVGALLAFYMVMFVFIEGPIVAFVFARDWTGRNVARFNAWLRANQKRIVVWVLIAGGCYLTARGIYASVT
jgi:hypothetical protein